MDNFSEEQMELPPGFRFHPTDEELITHYLTPKFDNSSFAEAAIGEVDLNKVEPWDLPWKAKMGEKEWYFFSVRDRKYPTGSRTNRATESGYWKATGKDKEIHKAKTLVGMKKTLVFYKGRAPRGEKTNWVMHEYRLEGKYSVNNNLTKTAKSEWVISRIFHKTSGGKKTHISGLVRLGNYGDEFKPSNLPPLIDISRTTKAETSHVTCFSEQMEDRKFQDKNVHIFNPRVLPSSSPSKPFDSSCLSPKIPISNSFFSTQISLQYPESFSIQEQSILSCFPDYNGEESEMKKNSTTEFWGMSTDMSSVVSNHEMGQRSHEDQEYPITSGGPVDLACLWNYSI